MEKELEIFCRRMKKAFEEYSCVRYRGAVGGTTIDVKNESENYERYWVCFENYSELLEYVVYTLKEVEELVVHYFEN